MAGIALSNPAGGMDVCPGLCVLCSEDKGQSQDNQDEGQTKYREPKSNPAGDMEVRFLFVLWVEGSATGRSLVERSPIDCNVSLCVI